MYLLPIADSSANTLAARVGDGNDYCSCVSYARSLSPKPIVRPTNARDIVPNSWTPGLGAWIVFVPGGQYNYWGHVATVIGIDYGTQMILIREANYIPCQVGERWISIGDPDIRGYYK